MTDCLAGSFDRSQAAFVGKGYSGDRRDLAMLHLKWSRYSRRVCTLVRVDWRVAVCVRRVDVRVVSVRSAIFGNVSQLAAFFVDRPRTERSAAPDGLPKEGRRKVMEDRGLGAGNCPSAVPQSRCTRPKTGLETATASKRRLLSHP